MFNFAFDKEENTDSSKSEARTNAQRKHAGTTKKAHSVTTSSKGIEQGASNVSTDPGVIAQPTTEPSKDASKKTIKLSDYIKKKMTNKDFNNESLPTFPNNKEQSADDGQVAPIAENNRSGKYQKIIVGVSETIPALVGKAEDEDMVDSVVDTIDYTMLIDKEGNEASDFGEPASMKATESGGTTKQGSKDKTKDLSGATTKNDATSSGGACSRSKNLHHNLADSSGVLKRKRANDDDDDEDLPLSKAPRKQAPLKVRIHTTDNKTALLIGNTGASYRANLDCNMASRLTSSAHLPSPLRFSKHRLSLCVANLSYSLAWTSVLLTTVLLSTMMSYSFIDVRNLWVLDACNDGG